MKVTDLSLREKVLQTAVLRLNNGRESSVKNAGAAFFFGEIIKAVLPRQKKRS